jgi:NAD(P)-dependent dehydrogenase (short-subunit alcohol dehydrogenase family)
MHLNKKRIVIIGGSSGIGFATAKAAFAAGAEVIIGSRSIEKLTRAKERIHPDVLTKQVDIHSILTLQKFFQEIGNFDHLQLPGSDFKTGSFLSFPIMDAKSSFDNKFWGPFSAAKEAVPYLNKGGSITFYSGAYSRRPTYQGSAIAAAINSAIEGLVRALACELSPIRVNAISPGLTMTERFTENYSADALKKLTNTFCEQLIIKRPAEADEIAKAAMYLMTNSYSTGNTLFVDGGLTLN